MIEWTLGASQSLFAIVDQRLKFVAMLRYAPVEMTFVAEHTLPQQSYLLLHGVSLPQGVAKSVTFPRTTLPGSRHVKRSFPPKRNVSQR